MKATRFLRFILNHRLRFQPRVPLFSANLSPLIILTRFIWDQHLSPLRKKETEESNVVDVNPISGKK